MENLVGPDLFIHCGKPLLALNLFIVENLLLGPHLFTLTIDVHNIKVSPSKQVSTSSSSGSSIVRMVQDSPDSVYLDPLLLAHVDTLMWREPPLVLHKKILDFQLKWTKYKIEKMSVLLDLHKKLTAILPEFNRYQATLNWLMQMYRQICFRYTGYNISHFISNF